jgi:DNA modification methylase
MAVADQVITDKYALYSGDCMDVMSKIPDGKIHFSIYSPPFGGLYIYSSSDRDLSNCASYDGFFAHYEFIVKELARVTMPGRMTAVHCMDIVTGNTGNDGYIDFPGDIIRLHQKFGFRFVARHGIWKEPLAVRNRTMMKNLAHRTFVEDSTKAGVAAMDQLLIFRKSGDNPIPVTHPTGLMNYIGERLPPNDILHYKGHQGNQRENRFSHWIWRQYASSFWDDIRIDRVLPFRAGREENDEAHVHPLQLDVIERAIVMRSNPGETVFTPFMGVGSEVYGAVTLGRRGIGAELKPSYFRQSVKNLKSAAEGAPPLEQQTIEFDDDPDTREFVEMAEHAS